MKTKKRPTGRPTKIDNAVKEKVLACLTVGASIRDAADYVGIDVTTLFRARKTDESFAMGVKQAIKKGKLRHLNKLAKATAWQASAWMLERRWGREYGRKDHVSQTVKGEVKHDHKHQHEHKFDHASYEQEFDRVLSRPIGSQNGDSPSRN